MQAKHAHLRSMDSRQHRQRGVAAVEFALVSMFFLTLLIGAMELGRWLFVLNAASEATRWGARLAVVCDMNDAQIRQRMRSILRGVTDDQITITYSPTACDTNACTATVSLADVTFSPMIPALGGTYALPAFSTTLPRELMSSADNPVCQ